MGWKGTLAKGAAKGGDWGGPVNLAAGGGKGTGGGGGYGGKGMKGGKGKPPAPVGDPLWDATQEAMAAVAHLETQWTAEEMVQRVYTYIKKASTKYQNDERASQKGSAVAAHALVEEFVDSVMGAISAGCYDKAWWSEVNLSAAVLQAVMTTFTGCKLFARTLAPMVQKFVDEGIFRFREEERITRGFWDTVGICGIPEGQYQKKTIAHLNKSFDEAHLSANFGEIAAETPEMGMLKDFVKAWMADFTRRAWDILQNAVGSEKEEHFAFVVALFQQLCGPTMCCLPHELTFSLETPPPEAWDFIGEAAEEVFAEDPAQSGPPAKKRKGGGKGW